MHWLYKALAWGAPFPCLNTPQHRQSKSAWLGAGTNGCSTVAQVDVPLDPTVLTGADLQKTNISCFGNADGSLAIHAVQGGTPPLVYAIDNQSFSINTLFTGLLPGLHTLLVQDAKGCEYQTSFELFEPPLLTVDLGPDTILQLGDAILISSNVSNAPERVENLIVTPSDLILDSLFQPVFSLDYSITVIDSNGCEASDSRRVKVDRTHHIYIPNVFNPQSSLNLVLYVFGGQDVAEIESFQIYDRWGDHIFEQFHFKPNDPASGWSGHYKGQEVNPGVFVYQALIRFIDGERKLYTGDITVVR